jgi:hypothetical protein
MAAPKATTAPSSPGEDIQVESVAQFVDEWSDEQTRQQLRAYIAQMGDLERNVVSRPILDGVPTSIRNRIGDWVIIRLGTLSDVRRKDTILAQRFLLEQQGWKHIPGCRHTRFPFDGEFGVYMGCSPGFYAELQDIKRTAKLKEKAMRKSKRERELEAMLKQSGVHLEDFAGKTEQFTQSFRVERK